MIDEMMKLRSLVENLPAQPDPESRLLGRPFSPAANSLAIAKVVSHEGLLRA